MNPTNLSQAIEQVFPELDSETRADMTDKVMKHMFVIMKEKVFAQDSDGLQKIEKTLKEETDNNQRATLYVKQIIEKFQSLPEEEQKTINKELDNELTTVMHKIYQAYE